MSREKEPLGRRFLRAVLIVPLLIILSPISIAIVIFHFIGIATVYLLIWICWLPKGKDVLFVSSNSPVWGIYMKTEVLPLLVDRAVVLNYSERQKWSKWSLSVRVFRTFQHGRDFNPMVVLFRPFRRAKAFRFFRAFMDFKHGRTEKIDQLRRDLIAAL